MGVHGLWKLLEPAGKPVPVETLENKVLAVDVSIWLHQLVKGFQDSSGSSLPNAHLLGLYHRICKLLFFKIKPVFVFDGGVPVLKRRTMAARQNQKSKADQAAEKLREQLLRNLLKQKAVGQVLEEIRGEKTSPQKADMFALPPIAEDDNPDSEFDDASSSSSDEPLKQMRYRDLHSIDVKSQEFKSLPADIRHDILTELKETRKQNSWGRLHEMPEESNDFSTYQMKRLLTRRSVQVSLEEAEKEMGGRTLSLVDVETMLKEGGVELSSDVGKRIASDATTRYLYINKLDGKSTSTNQTAQNNVTEHAADENNSSGSEIDCTDLNTIEEMYVASDASSDCVQENMKTSQKYLIENSDLTQDQILAVIKEQSGLTKSLITNIDAPSTSKQSLVNDYEDKKEIEDVIKENASIGEEEQEKINLLLESNSICLSPKSIPEKLLKTTPQAQLIQTKKIVNINNSLKNKEEILFDKNQSLVVNNESINKTKPKMNVPISKVRADILKSLNVQLKELSNSNVIKVEVNSPVKSDVVDKIKIESNLPMNGSLLPVQFLPEDTEDIADVKNKSDLPTVNRLSPVEIIADKAKRDFVNSSPNKEEIEAGVISSSESDSDFLDVPSPTASLSNTTVIKKETLPCIQVQIEPKDVWDEDDIFADVFEEKGEVDENIITSAFTDSKKSVIENPSEAFEENKTVAVKGQLNLDKEVAVEDVKGPSVENESDNSSYLESEEIGSSCDTSQNVELSSKPNQQEEIVSKPKLSSKELVKLQSFLENQEHQLIVERGKEERVASTITEQMYVEAQELLQLFGVPYVVAPMEAEAQCAFLDSIGLTQGTITDDSDIWLFGGRKVYKNFFSQNKYVLQFQSDDIQHFFKLARAQLVLLALLVGSDYTVGVQGVGPVTALEILASFPPPLNADGTDVTLLLASLEKFKQWLKSPPATSLGKKLKDVQLQPGFPSPEVVKAYLSPTIDDSAETFSWGTPDLDALRDFAERKFGWNKTRSDSVLLPVMKKLSEKSNQQTLDNYFQTMPNIPARREQMSARVQRAVQRIGGGGEFIEPVVSQRRGTRGGTRSRGRGRGRGRGRASEEYSVRSHVRERSELDPLEPIDPVTFNDELIPQREQDRLDALKRKMKAIEVMKSSKKPRGGKNRRNIRLEKKEAKLSESSSDDEKVS